MNKSSLLLVAAATAGLSLQSNAALVFSESNLGLAIPDADAGGILRTITTNGIATDTTYGITVSLQIQGTGFGGLTGDLYGYLSHAPSGGGYGMAVLLNRPGRTAGNSFGYFDDGLDVTFSDTAATDIHRYRDSFGSNPGVPAEGGTLTGTWQPDGRNVDPYSVTDASPRTTSLDSLGLLDPNGSWNLFLADLEAGGTVELASWSITLTPSGSASVPEPSQALATAMLASLLVLYLLGRRRFRADRVSPTHPGPNPWTRRPLGSARPARCVAPRSQRCEGRPEEY